MGRKNLILIDPQKIAAKRQKAKSAARRQRKAARRAAGLLRPKSWCRVYALKDGAGRVVYVGQTKSELSRRLMFHRKSADVAGSPVQRWMTENTPTICLLEEGVWDVSEVVWIERMRAAGEPLLNCNMGGRDSGKRTIA